MLLSNEAELLAMEAEKYSGLNPIVVDNNNLTIGLDSGFMDAVSSISGAISGLDNKLDISAFTGYSAALDSGLSNAFETVHNEITELQGDTSYLSGSIDYLSGVVTTGLSAYSAGPNIDITDYVISGKDWTNTIKEASANAYNEATALIPPAFDPTYMSGVIDNKLNTTAFSMVSGDFATTGDLQNYATTSWVSNINTAIRNDMGTIATNTANNYSAITSTSSFLSGAVDNKLDTTAFSDVSGTFITAHQSLADYATTAWVDSQGYLTSHQPISADEWNNVYETVNVYSGSWTGSESSPTASVDSNGSIDIVSSNNTVYFDVNGTWFNDAVNSAYTGSQGDVGVNNYVRNNSATIDNVNTTVQSNSSTWNNVNNKLDTTAFSDVSGTFLTAHQSLEGYATTAWVDSQGYLTELPASAEETLGIVNTNSGIWDSVTGKEDTISYGYSAGAISSINGSAIMGETIPYEVYGISAGENVTIWEENNTLWISAEAGQGGDVEVNDLVHSNSAIWDDVTNKLDATAYIPFDPTYLSGVIDNKLDTTAFNIPTSSNWNDVYNTVNSNSGLWSAGDTEVNTTVQNNSATWNNVSNKLDTTSFSDVSGSFLTAHQSLEGYATTAWVDSQGYLTAHQPISAEDWNGTYETVQSNSASWGQGSTFTGVDTDSTLTGNGKDTPLGVAEVQTLSSNNTISITSANDVVTLGVNETWFNNVNTTVQTNSGTWEGYGSDISYLSASIGDVESLLAQL